MHVMTATPLTLPDQHDVSDFASDAPVRTLRVLHVLPELYPGGMERAMLRIVQAISRDPDDSQKPYIENQFCILKHADEAMRQQCENAGTTYMLGRAREAQHALSSRFVFRQLARLIERVQPDVVHARTTSAWIDAALAVRHTRLHHRPRLLLSYHGRTSATPNSLWQTMRQTPKRWAARQADAVMAVSREIAQMLEHRWHVSSDRVVVLPNGVDTQIYHPPESSHTKRALRSALGIPETAAMILCVANLVPIKNHELLLQSFRKVALTHPHAHLYLLGQGPCEPALRYLARDPRETGRHHRIHFLGNRGDVPSWLRAADIFTLPSLFEGCSNALLEAMASGLPAAVSDIPGNQQLIRHGATGALLPVQAPQAWADQISVWLKDRSAARRLGHAARVQVAENYSLEHAARRYVALYTALARCSSAEEVASCAE